ncbi:MAG TPA: 7TM diverse intracellular signaling domain-containing protein [Bacteroidia bacterium]|jgi:hypothetical protein
MLPELQMKKILSACILFFMSDGLRAQELLSLSHPQQAQQVSGHAVYFIDTHNELNGPTDAFANKGFTAIAGEVANLDMQSAAVWARMKLTCTEKADWYLMMDPAAYEKVIFYEKRGASGWKELQAGLDPGSNVPMLVNHILVKLDLEPGDTTWVAIKVKDLSPIQFDLKAGDLYSFISSIHGLSLFDGICIGTLLLMFVYNLFLYFSNRDRIYLYYILYIFFSFIFSVLISGYAFYFPQFLIRLIQLSPVVIQVLFGVFGLLFTLRFLSIEKGTRLYRIISVFNAIALADMLLSFFPSCKLLSLGILQVLGMGLTVMSICAGIIAARKGNTNAWFYLFGYGIFTISLIILVLSGLNILPITVITWHVLLCGSGIEAVVLSLAIGNKLRIVQRQKEMALAENERILREQNVLLEKLVMERTSELQQKNKDILDSIHYARRIQQSLLPSEKSISRTLEKKDRSKKAG